ncbi:hypothetical protein [Saltatorellus ferox]|uniref:hypothetical protein n=1 Tax=Saltatorellus ferox TaxID=2528018 RepID=UPI003AF3719A
MPRLLRYLWASPNTLIGLAFCGVARLTGGETALVDGVLETHGGWTRFALGRNPFMRHGIAAITFGHVVVGRDAFQLQRTRVHERVHVRQYETFGPFFLPAYGLSSAWCLCRRVDPYRQNIFEREAYRIEAEWRERFG